MKVSCLKALNKQSYLRPLRLSVPRCSLFFFVVSISSCLIPVTDRVLYLFSFLNCSLKNTPHHCLFGQYRIHFFSSIVTNIFRKSLTLPRTSSFLTLPVHLIFRILLDIHILKAPSLPRSSRGGPKLVSKVISLGNQRLNFSLVEKFAKFKIYSYKRYFYN